MQRTDDEAHHERGNEDYQTQRDLLNNNFTIQRESLYDPSSLQSVSLNATHYLPINVNSIAI